MRDARRAGLLAAALVGLCLCSLSAPIAHAQRWDGERAPNDPEYDIAERQPFAHVFPEEQWFLYSFIPVTAPLATDPEGAAGMSIDRAWHRYGTGRRDVRIAYIEGGVNWRRADARRELAPRSYLNTGELPRPARSATYDANGDGDVNVADYANDPRVHKPYLNGDITPEDLIVAFSDGRDADANGYTDDIAGWNFSRGNNDPQTEDSAYTHANSQMMRAAAEGDNANAGVGICPHCTLIPIKAADEALLRPDRLGQSIYFAVDAGASVIVIVAGELGYATVVKRALDYAWGKGVVVVEASNDFNSGDHQGGMFWPRVWPGNGLVADTTGALERETAVFAKGFRNRSNYTSFGTHSLFSMPNQGGTTSESTPTQGGVAALMSAYGRRAADEGIIRRPLDAGEIKQLLRAASSPMDRTDVGNYPGKPGATFSLHYGYGRPNVDRALTALLDRRIPPVPDILSPSWYALYDPTRTEAIAIRADIRARRARRFSWTAQWALGAEPAESEFHTIAGGSARRRLRGELAKLSLADIPRTVWDRRLAYTADLRSTEQHTITLRVQATDEHGVMGEDRRAVAVFHDPSTLPGFPKFVGAGKESSPVPVDLDGDGARDLVFGDSDGTIRAVNGRGRTLAGWPVRTDVLPLGLGATPAGRAGAVPVTRDPVPVPLSVGDLDGDGRPEVVATSLSGRIYVFEPDGSRRPGWPRRVGAASAGLGVPPPDRPYTRLPSQGAYSPAALAPLPGGSHLDVVQSAWDGRLYAFDADGVRVPGWPVDGQLPPEMRPRPPCIDVHDHKLVATPTMADLDGDGRLEVVVKSQEFCLIGQGQFGVGSRFYVQAFWWDGNRHPGGARVPGWPVEVPGVIGAYGTAQDFLTEGGDPASATDLDGDGRDEVLQPLAFAAPALIDGPVVRAPAGPAPRPADVEHALRRPAAMAVADPAVPLLVPVGFTTSGALARFDGRVLYAAGGTDLLSLSSLLFPGQPIRITNGIRLIDPLWPFPPTGFPAPLMGLPFLTSPAVADVSGDGRPDIVVGSDTSNLAAVQQSGSPVSGWPKFTGGWTLFTPAIGDFFGDGAVEVAATTREGYLFVWRTPGREGDVQVGTWQQNARHDGRLGG